jgi:hypothetical protein
MRERLPGARRPCRSSASISLAVAFHDLGVACLGEQDAAEGSSCLEVVRVLLEQASQLRQRRFPVAASGEAAGERETGAAVVRARRQQPAQTGLELARSPERGIGRLELRIDQRSGPPIQLGNAQPGGERRLGAAALGFQLAEDDPRAPTSRPCAAPSDSLARLAAALGARSGRHLHLERGLGGSAVARLETRVPARELDRSRVLARVGEQAHERTQRREMVPIARQHLLVGRDRGRRKPPCAKSAPRSAIAVRPSGVPTSSRSSRFWWIRIARPISPRVR